MSDGFETPRWDDDDELTALGEPPAAERDAPEGPPEPDDGEDEAGDDGAAAKLEDPWVRAAREARDAEEGAEPALSDDVDRSSENVLGSWPGAQAEPRDEPPHETGLGAVPGGLGEGWTPAPAASDEHPAEPEADPSPADVSEEAADDAVAAEAMPAGEPEPADSIAEPAVEPQPEPGPDEAPALPELGSTTAEHAPGDLVVPPGVPLLEGIPRGERRSVGIVVSRFNGDLTTKMLDRALEELSDRGVASEAITVLPVPGAFELPLAAMALAKTRRFSCIVALGCVIRGDTPHFDYVASETASGLQLAAIETGVPVAFGVLTLDRVEQAQARIDKGAVAARTALEMADIFANLRAAAAR